jgi:endoglucanase
MESLTLLKRLSECMSISGSESGLEEILKEAFLPLCDTYEKDIMNNFIFLKKGADKENAPKIMLSGHGDEIGLMVKEIDKNGRIFIAQAGGFDPRTLIGQQVRIHGERVVKGVIAAPTPYFDRGSTDALKLRELYVDTGLSKEELEKIIEVGNFVSLKREFWELKNKRVSGKALDDKAGVLSLYETALDLQGKKHDSDVYFVISSREEIGADGAMLAAHKINPDIAMAVDVGFGETPDTPKDAAIGMGKGPSMAIGSNIHPTLNNKIIEVAKEERIPYQVEFAPNASGTDGWAIQMVRSGVPCLVISIPLRYMHTSVEVIDMEDSKLTGLLMSRFIQKMKSDELEAYLCY